jgi:molybdate transport system regulatory protein
MSKRAERKREALPIRLRGRLGIEVGQRTGLSEAGADLLEQIAISGSLSEAARQLHYSYRWAWLLTDAMNRAWGEPLVKTAVGGKRGGGAKLTELGERVLAAYRHLQVELEHFLDQHREPFARAARMSS